MCVYTRECFRAVWVGVCVQACGFGVGVCVHVWVHALWFAHGMGVYVCMCAYQHARLCTVWVRMCAYQHARTVWVRLCAYTRVGWRGAGEMFSSVTSGGLMRCCYSRLRSRGPEDTGERRQGVSTARPFREESAFYTSNTESEKNPIAQGRAARFELYEEEHRDSLDRVKKNKK